MAMSEQQGIQSADAAMRILVAMANSPRAMPLKEIAAAADMAPGNAHRYLVSMMRVQLVRQESANGRYDLGALALRLGIAAMSRLDAVEIAGEALVELRDEIDMPAFLSVWTEDGPTIVRWLDAGHDLTINIRLGARARLLSSASGGVFLTWGDEERTRPLIVRELRAGRNKDGLTTWAEVEALRARIRHLGVAWVTGGGSAGTGEGIAGINGLSAPVFDAAGRLQASITSVGLQEVFDVREDGPLVAAVRAAGERASRRLGYRGDHQPDEASAPRKGKQRA
jgi:DNA-binding IclR family transcriptional regulator